MTNVRGWESDWISVDQNTTRCGRCSKEITPKDDAEACWFCSGDLCVECWEQYGHCGHERAEEINQQMREWYASIEELEEKW